MKQQPTNQRRFTADQLGLAAWVPTGAGSSAGLGTLSGALGEFLPGPSPRIVLPSQRGAALPVLVPVAAR